MWARTLVNCAPTTLPQSSSNRQARSPAAAQEGRHRAGQADCLFFVTRWGRACCRSHDASSAHDPNCVFVLVWQSDDPERSAARQAKIQDVKGTRKPAKGQKSKYLACTGRQLDAVGEWPGLPQQAAARRAC